MDPNKVCPYYIAHEASSVEEIERVIEKLSAIRMKMFSSIINDENKVGFCKKEVIAEPPSYSADGLQLRKSKESVPRYVELLIGKIRADQFCFSEYKKCKRFQKPE